MACSRTPKCRLRPRDCPPESPRAFEGQRRLGRASQVSRPPSSHGTRLPGHLAPCRWRRVPPCLFCRRETRDVVIPALGKPPVLHAVNLVAELWMLRSILLEQGHPALTQTVASCTQTRRHVLAHPIGGPGTWHPQASHRRASSDESLRRPAARRGRAGVLLVGGRPRRCANRR